MPRANIVTVKNNLPELDLMTVYRSEIFEEYVVQAVQMQIRLTGYLPFPITLSKTKTLLDNMLSPSKIADRALSDYESAYHIAETIIRSGCRNMPYLEAWGILLEKKDEHTEQMAMVYLVEHTPQDECWDIVTSYLDSDI